MKRSAVGLFTLALLLGGDVLLPVFPAGAADATQRPGTVRGLTLPFPRGEREQAVWASGACWSECGAYCAWGLAGCLERDAQGQCLKLTDSCDRICQRRCRSSGGPLLPLDF